MTIETDIKARLDGHSGLAALIGTRSRAIKLKQNEIYPALTYRRITTNIENTLDNLHASNPRYQFDIVSDSYESVRQVVAQLIDAMTTATTFTALYIDDQDLNFDNGPGIYRNAVDFSVWQQ